MKLTIYFRQLRMLCFVKLYNGFCYIYFLIFFNIFFSIHLPISLLHFWSSAPSGFTMSLKQITVNYSHSLHLPQFDIHGWTAVFPASHAHTYIHSLDGKQMHTLAEIVLSRTHRFKTIHKKELIYKYI